MIRRLLLLGLVGAIAGPVAATPPPLSPMDAEKVHRVVRPAPDEDAFATIPWLTSLWEARQIAAKEGKPILLWEMDGHPLGCG
jgi:hypothetical protein